MAYSFEEVVCELDGQIHLGERVEVFLEDVGVGVDLAQLRVQLVDGGFEIDHLPGLRRRRQLVHREDVDVALEDLGLQVTQFPFHVVAAAHLARERALERRCLRVQLHPTHFTIPIAINCRHSTNLFVCLFVWFVL